jgi:hypothetical protein
MYVGYLICDCGATNFLKKNADLIRARLWSRIADSNETEFTSEFAKSRSFKQLVPKCLILGNVTKIFFNVSTFIDDTQLYSKKISKLTSRVRLMRFSTKWSSALSDASVVVSAGP